MNLRRLDDSQTGLVGRTAIIARIRQQGGLLAAEGAWIDRLPIVG